MIRKQPRYSSLQVALLKKLKGLQKILVIDSKACQDQTNSIKERITKSQNYDPVSISRLKSYCSSFTLEKNLYYKFVDFVISNINNQNVIKKRIDFTIDSICGQVSEQKKHELYFSSKNNNQKQFYLQLYKQKSLVKQVFRDNQGSSPYQVNREFNNYLRRKKIIIQRSLLRNQQKSKKLYKNIEIQQKYERKRTIFEYSNKSNQDFSNQGEQQKQAFNTPYFSNLKIFGINEGQFYSNLIFVPSQSDIFLKNQTSNQSLSEILSERLIIMKNPQKVFKISKPIKKVQNKIYLQDRVSKTVQKFLEDSLKNLRDYQLYDKCIKEIFKVFRYTNKEFEAQVQEFKQSIKNFLFSNPSFYLHFETYLYELLNNSLILMNKYIDDNEKSLIYFTLIVTVLKILCNSNLYIFTYNMCKSIDVIIQKMSQVVKNTKIYDELILKYHQYQGLCQTNFDQINKFYDFQLCKMYINQILYKKYSYVDLQQQPNIQNLTSCILDNIPQANNIISSNQGSKNKFRVIKGKSKKNIKSSQTLDDAQAFSVKFCSSLIFFRQEKSIESYNFLEETLTIFKRNSKLDLGIQQINRCFPFQCKDSLNKACLKTIRYIMQREKLIKQVDFAKYTIYEKFISLNEGQREQISNVGPNKKQCLIKYLKLLADTHIYNIRPIQFLNLWRCISILDNQEIIKYMLYLEQLQWCTQDQCEDKYYRYLNMELESKLISFTNYQKQFWHLTYQNMKQNFKENKLIHQYVDVQKDFPILSIRKIMNNIFIEIQQHLTNSQDKFTLLFNKPYEEFKKEMQEDKERQKNERYSHYSLQRLQYSSSLKINQKRIFLKVMNLPNLENDKSIEFNFTIYQFVQEIAASIYLREKQKLQYQQHKFNKNIGYQTINSYIYHFVQDFRIFIILENCDILPENILNQNHFRKKDVLIQDKDVISHIHPQIIVDVQGRNNTNNTQIQQQQQQEQQKSTLQLDMRYLLKFSKSDLFKCMLILGEGYNLYKENSIRIQNQVNYCGENEPIIIGLDILELYIDFSYYMSDSGTMRYKSYQQIKGQPINENSDFSSLIITIYELATGQAINLEDQRRYYFNKAQYISQHAQEELSDLFSKDFIDLIEFSVDSQLDTTKPRGQYFVYLKFEILMNLLFDCCDQNCFRYQQFYKIVKKAIFRGVVKKQKYVLQVKFNIQKLISLNKNNTFLMLISLQADHNILKMYESILSVVLNNQKMEEYKQLMNNTLIRHSVSNFVLEVNRSTSSSFVQANEYNFQTLSQYCIKNQNIAEVIQIVYDRCLINSKSLISLPIFQQDIITIFNSDFILQNLLAKKYEFDSVKLKQEHQAFSFIQIQITQQERFLINKLFLKLIKTSFKLDVINQIIFHMEETQKNIFQFQQLKNQKIQESQNEINRIKESIVLMIKNQFPLNQLARMNSQQLNQNFQQHHGQLQDQFIQDNEFEEQIDQNNQQIDQDIDENSAIFSFLEHSQQNSFTTNQELLRNTIIGMEERTFYNMDQDIDDNSIILSFLDNSQFSSSTTNQERQRNIIIGMEEQTFDSESISEQEINQSIQQDETTVLEDNPF